MTELYRTGTTLVKSVDISPLPSDRLARARALWRAYGGRVVPVNLQKKGRIKWGPIQHEPATAREIEKWFGPRSPFPANATNAAILTGCSGLVVVDYDTADGIAWGDDHVPGTQSRVQTRRGEHRYYRAPRDAAGAFHRVRMRIGGHVHGATKRLGIDIKGHGGFIVAPGSIHESGHVYAPLPGFTLDIEALPEFDARWFDGLCFCGLKNGECSGRGGARAPARNDDGYVPPQTADGARTDIQPRTASDAGFVRLRATRWAEKAYTGAPAGGRDNAAYAMARDLRIGFMLSPEETIEIMRVVNATFTPPLPDRELLIKIHSAERSTRLSPGYILDTPPKRGDAECQRLRPPRWMDRQRARVDRDANSPPPTTRTYPTTSGTPSPSSGSATSIISDSPTGSGVDPSCTPSASTNDVRGFSGAARELLRRIGFSHFNRGTAGRRRFLRVSNCGLARADFCCEAGDAAESDGGHGVDHSKFTVCELGSACPHCSSKRAITYSNEVLANWPTHVAVAVFHAPEDPSESVDLLRMMRRAITRRMPKKLAYRWLLGLDRGAFFVRAPNEVYLKIAAEEAGIACDVRVVSRFEAARLVHALWTEPAARFRQMVDAADMAVVNFPFTACDDVSHRSDGSRAGEEPLPWLSQVALRTKLVEEARRARGTDGYHCSHAGGDGCPCGRTLVAHVRDVRDEEELFVARPGTPFWKIARAASAVIEAKRARPAGRPAYLTPVLQT